MPDQTDLSQLDQDKTLEVAKCDLKPVSIEPLIRVIRGQQVMLDADLAPLYGIETKRLKEQVNRNLSRFPEDFMFKLSASELSSLRSQFATSNKRGGTRYAPYAFTESGIAMLSSVLHTETAIATNIQIMRAFTAMRHLMAASAQVMRRLADIEYHQIESDKRIDEVFKRLDQGATAKQGIFFDGQIFDAYTFVSDLIRSAKKRVVLFDNYVDDSVLAMLDKRSNGVSAGIYTRTLTPQLMLDLQRHNAQYSPIAINEFQNAHDRFLCIDDTVYHIGASLKDLGKKWFAFSRMELDTDTLLQKM